MVRSINSSGNLLTIAQSPGHHQVTLGIFADDENVVAYNFEAALGIESNSARVLLPHAKPGYVSPACGCRVQK